MKIAINEVALYLRAKSPSMYIPDYLLDVRYIEGWNFHLSLKFHDCDEDDDEDDEDDEDEDED